MDGLISHAIKARENAHAPYSNFKVGAAVRTASGKIFVGVNVENASYGLTCCAERVAIFTAVASGESDILELAVVADGINPVQPCGACRQVITEFLNADSKVIMGNITGSISSALVSELLPNPFS